MPLPKPWLSPDIVDRILVVGGEQASVGEACGILTPDQEITVLPNRSTDPGSSYVIGNEDLIEAIADYIERSGVDPEEVTREHVLIWHTHPSGNIGPSRGDMQSRVDGFMYGVVTLPNGPATLF